MRLPATDVHCPLTAASGLCCSWARSSKLAPYLFGGVGAHCRGGWPRSRAAVVARRSCPGRADLEQVFNKYLQSVNGADVTLASQVWLMGPDLLVVTPFGRFQGWDTVKNRPTSICGRSSCVKFLNQIEVGPGSDKSRSKTPMEIQCSRAG